MSNLRNSPLIILLFINAFCLLMGGGYLWGGFLLLAGGSIVMNMILPPDTASHDTKHTVVPNTLLFLMLPLLYLNIVLFNWQMSPDDFLSIGKLAERMTGIAIQSHKASRLWSDTVGAYFSLIILTTSGGTVVAHELVHRVWNPTWVTIGRWLLAPTFDTSFSIEHVYGHHANVSTWKDPASSRRGENPYTFFVRSSFYGIIGAWEIEKKRLAKRYNKGPWTLRSIFLRGQLMSLSLLAFYIAAQGTKGIASFFILAILGKFYLELVNFVEHYGLVRVPGSPVEIKHSWNSNNRFSLWVLFNLPRHSHHHAKGHLPFWKLEANPHAPTLPYGYLSMILISLFPPLHRRIMAAPLKDWDDRLASPAEKELIQKLA